MKDIDLNYKISAKNFNFASSKFFRFKTHLLKNWFVTDTQYYKYQLYPFIWIIESILTESSFIRNDFFNFCSFILLKVKWRVVEVISLTNILSEVSGSGTEGNDPVFYFYAYLPSGDKCGKQTPITGIDFPD